MMRSKTSCYLLACLMIISIVSSACAAGQNQPAAVQTSPALETTATPIAATSTSTQELRPTASRTPVPTATPTLYPIEFPPDCGKVKRGRAGTQVIDHTTDILVQGTAIMCGAIYVDSPFRITLPVLPGMLDLDTGTFNVEDADFQFCPGGGSTLFYYFCDVGHSILRKYQAYPAKPKQPPYEECLTAIPYSGINDDEIKYACVVTNSGNFSRVKVERFDPLADVISVEISFITWSHR